MQDFEDYSIVKYLKIIELKDVLFLKNKDTSILPISQKLLYHNPWLSTVCQLQILTYKNKYTWLWLLRDRYRFAIIKKMLLFQKNFTE